jgi:hypothetical protein
MTDTAQTFPSEMSEVDALNEIRDEGTPEEEVEEEEVKASLGVDEHGNDLAEPEPEPVLAPPGTIEFEGRFLPVDEVRALLALNDKLKNEPETSTRVAAALKEPEPANVLPSWIDPDDPTAVRLYEEVQSAKAETAKLQAQNNQRSEQDRRAQVVDSFRSAVSSFKGRYPDLTEEQVAKVADATGRANIIEGLERSEGSLTAAFDRGMEMTLWSDPGLRSLVALAPDAKVSAKSDRKGKQSALSPSGGSVPRTRETKVAKTRDELLDNMLNAVRNDPDLTG